MQQLQPSMHCILCITEKCDMFAPDRQGFFPGLWVQLLQDLSTADREAFASLATRAEKLQWMYNRSFVKVRFSTVLCDAQVQILVL